MKRSSFIYVLSDPRTNHVRYVGKTFNLKDRFSQHICLKILERNNTKNTAWIKSLLNLGLKPIMEVIEEFDADDVSGWEEAEKFWIKTLRFCGCDLNNLEPGGISGKTHSDETRLKISKSRVGFRHTEETKARIRASSKARMTESEKEHLRQVNLASGFRHTEETKQRIAASKIGKKRPAHVNAALQAGRLAWLAEKRASLVSQSGQQTIPIPQ